LGGPTLRRALVGWGVGGESRRETDHTQNTHQQTDK
jgi:hypothetical protein